MQGCIKPNAEKVPGKINGGFVCRQLRYLGVNAVVEINRVGYPIKVSTRALSSRALSSRALS